MSELSEEMVARAEMLKSNAHGVADEATVSTILNVPEAERSPFTANKARAIGLDAAIESVVRSIREMLADAPMLTEAAPTGYGVGWNKALARVREDVAGLADALVASRRRGYRTQAAPESLLQVTQFVEALHHIWAIHDWRDCRWSVKTDTCTVHPNYSSFTRQCAFNEAAVFLRASGVDPDTDAIPELLAEVRARRAAIDGG